MPTQTRATCVVLGTVEGVREQPYDFRAGGERVRFVVTLADQTLDDNSDSPLCARVRPNNFDTAKTNNYFKAGDKVRLELACHSLGSSFGCDAKSLERPSPATDRAYRLYGNNNNKTADTPEWVKKLPVAPGGSKALGSGRTFSHAVQLKTVTDIRTGNGFLWVAGYGVASLNREWLGELGSPKSSIRFELTLPADNNGCAKIAAEVKKSNRSLDVVGRALSTQVNGVQVLKFTEIGSCNASVDCDPHRAGGAQVSQGLCRAQCHGGNCRLRCEGEAICHAECGGGQCDYACGENASCDFKCRGGQCNYRCMPPAKCHFECEGGTCKYEGAYLGGS